MKGKLRAAALLAALLCMLAPSVRAAPEACAPGQHNYVENRRTPATAMRDGEAVYVCTLCGHEYTDTLFAVDHLWGDWVIDRAPTCTQSGIRRRTCTRAQPHDETTAIPALGHKYRETRTEPACEKAGAKTFTCTRCGDTYTERIAPLEHDYRESERIEPTCLEPGKIIFACARNPAHTCEEPIEAPGSHDFGEWVIQLPAREGVQGMETRECERCGYRERRALEALPVAVTAPPAAPPRTVPIMDFVLVGANIVSLGFFAALLIPYFLCLAYARRRRKMQLQRDALRKEVDALHGYK